MMSESFKVPLFLLFVLFSALPILGVHYDVIPSIYATYFYWAELAVVGVALIALYAKHLSVFFIMLLIAGAILSLEDNSFWEDLRVPISFWGLYSICWLFYFEIGKTRLVRAILNINTFSHLLFYLCFMASSIGIAFSLTATLFNGWDLIPLIPHQLYALFITMAAIIPTLTIGALKIIDYIGPKHVMHFFMGTYYRPVEKRRIVLFLDMVGSTSIAEKLSPKESMDFIASFIYDASLAFRLHGGDIVNYTGDGLVVLWPEHHSDHAVASVKTLGNLLIKNQPVYKQKFGITPDFRIGMHGGPVIINQLGEEKLFIGLYGDVVNTAARLEQMCKELEVKVLISRDVRKFMTPDFITETIPLGKKSLRGRDEKIEVYTLKKSQL